MEFQIKQEPVKYTGIVSLNLLDRRGLQIKRQTIKNNGVNNLFFLLCNLLNGELTNARHNLSDANSILLNIQSQIPRFLAIGSPKNVIGTSIDMTKLQDATEMGLNQRFLLTTNSVTSVDANGVVFTQWSCNIPHTSVGNAEIKELGLHPSEIGGANGASDLLARIITTTGQNPGIQIGDGQSLLVNWKIFFTNKNTEF
jgi:hypothetical protein